MRYAGPREAIWHAIMPARTTAARTSSSGRDHAGVGSYYGTYDAQEIFDELEAALASEPMFFEHVLLRACGWMASGKTCPHDGEEHVFLSGTMVREDAVRRASARGVQAPRGRPHPHQGLRDSPDLGPPLPFGADLYVRRGKRA